MKAPQTDAEIVQSIRDYLDQLRDLRIQFACQPDVSRDFRRGWIEAVRSEELGLRAMLDHGFLDALRQQEPTP